MTVPTEASLWPVRPKPFEDEVLSSWLLRTAEGHGMSLSNFRRQELPRVPGAGFDLDLICDSGFFSTLASKSGVSEARAFAGSYMNDEGLVFTQQVLGNYEWVIPLTQTTPWATKRFASIPFCGACLNSDEEPYYRKQWRYAFSPCCPKHGLLGNHCPCCHQPFSYLGPTNSTQRSNRIGALRHCAYCTHTFLPSDNQAPDQLVESVLEIELFIDRGLRDHWVVVGDKNPVHIALFLRGFRELITLLTRKSIGQRVANWVVASLGLPEFPGYVALGEGSFESRPALSRAWLVTLAYWLIQEWPTRFIWMVKQSGMPASNFFPPSRDRPGWMTLLEIEEMFYRPLPRNQEEIESARRFLSRKRGFAATAKETAIFMETGIAPPIMTLTRPTSPAAHQAMNEEFERGQRWKEAKELHQRTASPPKELYPKIGGRYRTDEFFETLDDSTTRLTGLAEKIRRDRAKAPRD